MIGDEELDDLDLLTDDTPGEVGDEGQLYEHFRMEVDDGIGHQIDDDLLYPDRITEQVVGDLLITR